MNILLTGSTGFIGRYVLSLLLSEGHCVVTLDRHQVSDAEKPQNDSLVRLIGDISTGVGFDKIPWEDLDAVIHLAASGVKASYRIWADAVSANIVGTQRVLNEIQLKCKKFPVVFIARTFYEHLTYQAPSLLENPYIATKLAASQLAELWARKYEGSTIFGTFFQVYGPGDASGNVLSYAVSEMKAGRSPVFGSGRGLRDWIYITDAAAAVLAGIYKHEKGLNRFDIGTGELNSIRSVIEQLACLLDHQVESISFDAKRDRDDVNLQLAAQKPPTGWFPKTSITEGLKAIYKSI